MFSVGCDRSLFGGRNAVRLFVVTLTAATLAACAQSSVATNKTASLVSSREASLAPNRAASFVTNRRKQVVTTKHNPFAPTNLLVQRVHCMDLPASTRKGQRPRAAKSWMGMD